MRLEGEKGGREGEEDLLHSPQTGEEEERHRGRREGTRQITISIRVFRRQDIYDIHWFFVYI